MNKIRGEGCPATGTPKDAQKQERQRLFGNKGAINHYLIHPQFGGIIYYIMTNYFEDAQSYQDYAESLGCESIQEVYDDADWVCTISRD